MVGQLGDDQRTTASPLTLFTDLVTTRVEKAKNTFGGAPALIPRLT